MTDRESCLWLASAFSLGGLAMLAAIKFYSLAYLALAERKAR